MEAGWNCFGVSATRLCAWRHRPIRTRVDVHRREDAGPRTRSQGALGSMLMGKRRPGSFSGRSVLSDSCDQFSRGRYARRDWRSPCVLQLGGVMGSGEGDSSSGSTGPPPEGTDADAIPESVQDTGTMLPTESVLECVARDGGVPEGTRECTSVVSTSWLRGALQGPSSVMFARSADAQSLFDFWSHARRTTLLNAPATVAGEICRLHWIP